MSNTSEKLRAVFLAALMIGSVFAATVALSGSVAAASNLNGDSISVTEVNEGEQVQTTIEYNVTRGSDTNSDWFTVYFNNTETGNLTENITDISVSQVNLYNNSSGEPQSISSPSSSVQVLDVNNDGIEDAIQFGDQKDVTDLRVVIDSTLTYGEVSGDTNIDANLSVEDSAGDNLHQTLGTITVLNDAEAPSFTGSTDQADNENAEINVSVTDNRNVDESSINVSVYNTDTEETIQIVENGSVVHGSALNSANFTDGTDNATEYVNVSAALPEGNYQVDASASDLHDNSNDQDNFDSFGVNMEGDALKVIPDDSNPLASQNASVGVVAVDSNGNELIYNESDVYANVSTLTWSPEQPDLVDVTSAPDGDIRPVANHSGSSVSYNATYDITASEPGDYSLTIIDTGDDATLTKASATQTYTAALASVDVYAEAESVKADDASTINVTLQLQDAQGNAIPRGGESISWSVNNTDATDVVWKNQTTDSEGQATIQLTASQAGQTIEVTGVEDTEGYSDTTNFTTVPGGVNASNSQFLFDGSSTDGQSATVNTTKNVSVQILDDASNPIPGMTVELSANDTAVTFANTAPTTNANGWANTTVTLPETAGTSQLNVSAGAFNTSAVDNASLNVTATPANASALEFATEDGVVAAEGSTNVSVAVVDEYGNINTSASGSIMLESSDASVINITDATKSITANGNATFEVNANATSGDVDLTATTDVANVSNATTSWSVQSASSIDVTFSPTSISTSSDAVNATKLSAQLTDENGEPLAIDGETVTFGKLSGNAAKLNSTSATTNVNGVATVWVNATANTGNTKFVAQADSYPAQGTGTLTTTGEVDSLVVTPNSTSIAENTSTTVSVHFEDSQGRTVPFTDTVSVSSTVGTMSPTSIKVNATNGFTGTSTLATKANQTGTANVTAIANAAGVAGQASITVTETGDGQVPPDAVYEPGSTAAEYDSDKDGQISLNELTGGATAYAQGDLSLSQLSSVATAYAQSN